MTRAATRRGRDVANLLADFGHEVPSRAPAARTAAEKNPFSSMVPRRGRAARYAGWSPAAALLSQWRMTSEQTPVFWPLIASNGLPPTGAQMGIDWLSGGAMYLDPIGWTLNEDIPNVTAPNVYIDGKGGRGKSSIVKAFLLRMLEFEGYRGLILGDVKDEYERFCRALGVEPFAIGPGMFARLNVLEAGPLAHGWAQLSAEEYRRRVQVIRSRWLVLLAEILGAVGVQINASTEKVLGEALDHLTLRGERGLAPVTVPMLWKALDEPTEDLVASCRYANRQDFFDGTRLLRDGLAMLCTGHLGGMFDDLTNIKIDWNAPIQSMSLSRVMKLGETATGVALACMSSWGKAMREVAEPGDHRITVRDENWLRNQLGLASAKGLSADLRLVRVDGDINLVVAHKPSDALAGGDLGSQAVNIAKDLFNLYDIKIHLGHDPEIAEELQTISRLKPIETNLITGWAMGGKGRSLWLVGDRRFKVETVLTPLERQLTYTNDAVAA